LSLAPPKAKIAERVVAEGLFLDGSRVPRGIPELTGELHNAIIGFLAATPSMLLAINQRT
jgi:hypothetical protein